MGQDSSRNATQSDARSLRSLDSAASFSSLTSSGEPMLSGKEAELEVNRVRNRISEFRKRAGTESLSAELYESWVREKDRVVKTWLRLTDPGRRALIMNAREKVVSRARVLHAVVAPQNISAYNKNKIVRKLMEKCCFELFDINVVYDDKGLPNLVEDVLAKHGGGNEIPVGLLVEINNTFEVERRQHASSSVSRTPSGIWNEVGYMLGLHAEVDEVAAVNDNRSVGAPLESDEEEDEAANASSASGESADQEQQSIPETLAIKLSSAGPSSGNESDDTFPLEDHTETAFDSNLDQKTIELADKDGNTNSVLVNNNSVNSFQGYYSRNAKKNARRMSSSKSIRNILSFVSEGLDMDMRRKLTTETLLALRSAFLVHFAILVFSELFDDEERVIHKYEYSDCDTDAGDSATDIDDDDEDDVPRRKAANPKGSSGAA
ncbi:Hypothetical Protein FCC1311_106752 [Hondaea fermentalgiana]|uniref:Uncharacterized protein n=1 Tax=Hondaea fermentalgiana TaxID=2315210 RepID=A0A2R5H0Z8_9STRA|nr:Hypothetical Protein FCC1311_106752 [Hondaea fermentalgiana]|eukprot:GBG34451.1 Hypothetical Protein FCC1311_106752 [Hondaea fermentalgiana]